MHTPSNVSSIYDECEACAKIIRTGKMGHLQEHHDCPGGGFIAITIIKAARSCK